MNIFMKKLFNTGWFLFNLINNKLKIKLNII